MVLSKVVIPEVLQYWDRGSISFCINMYESCIEYLGF
jgi:hypothetical protein